MTGRLLLRCHGQVEPAGPRGYPIGPIEAPKDKAAATSASASTTVSDNNTLVARLFAAQRGALQAFFARRVRGRDDTADLAQEVYLRMLRVKDVDAIRDPQAYLFAIAGNLVKEHWVVDRWRAASLDVDDFAVQNEIAVSPSIDAELDGDRAAERLYEVLRQLSPKCRAAVVLQYRDSLSYREIGARLGVSTNMVKKYLSHALIHCRRRMVPRG